MSGTSLDGLDIACVLFSHNTEQVDFVLEAAETVPLPTPLKELLLRIEEQICARKTICDSTNHGQPREAQTRENQTGKNHTVQVRKL